MSVELRPMGVKCNLSCDYCYQEPIRKAGNIETNYDIDKMLAEADKTNQEFHLFGGEALLVPIKDLEKIWKHGYEKFESNGIQTNGTLINDKHIELFKKYNVQVGISIDGPNELNRLRNAGSEEKTLRATQKILDNIMKLKKHGISVSVIITLHRMNGTPDKLPRLMSFIRWLGDIGVKYGNIHTLEVDKTMVDQEKNVLTQEENSEAFVELARFFKENEDLKWNPFKDTYDVLRGRDLNSLCYWNNCDPMNTSAVYGIEGDGSLSNCGRTNKEGIDWYKAEDRGYERYIVLYHTPDEDGGCKGCRFWIACGGSCPGEAIDGDFRNKTIHCHTQQALMSFYEKEIEKVGLIPVTKSQHRHEIEQYMLHHFMSSKRTTIYDALMFIQESTEIDEVEFVKEV